MTIDILDACALLALLKNEPGGSVIETRLLDPAVTCYVHSITLCEVYYQLIREAGEPYARQTIADLLASGIIERDDMNSSFWQSVGQLKARGGISLADCFCLALAIKLSGQVVTCDHGEFDPLVPLNICPIFFFR